MRARAHTHTHRHHADSKPAASRTQQLCVAVRHLRAPEGGVCRARGTGAQTRAWAHRAPGAAESRTLQRRACTASRGGGTRRSRGLAGSAGRGAAGGCSGVEAADSASSVICVAQCGIPEAVRGPERREGGGGGEEGEGADSPGAEGGGAACAGAARRPAPRRPRTRGRRARDRTLRCRQRRPARRRRPLWPFSSPACVRATSVSPAPFCFPKVYGHVPARPLVITTAQFVPDVGFFPPPKVDMDFRTGSLRNLLL